jgi:hypothetical protein
LKVGKASGAEGPDGLAPRFLKYLEEVSRSSRSDRLAMPASHRSMVMGLLGTYRMFREGTKSRLPNLGVVAPYYWEKPRRGSTLWGGGGLGAHSEGGLESPRRRNFVQAAPPLSAMSTDQAETARFFWEVYYWDLPQPTLP